MRQFYFRCYSPDVQEGGGINEGTGDASAMQAALETELGGAPEAKPAEKPAEGSKPEAKPDAGGKSSAPAIDDPEIDLEDGKDDKGLPKLKKVKMSELKKGYMQGADYTKKTQEIARQREELKALETFANALKGNKDFAQIITNIVEKSIGEQGYNQEYLTKTLGMLQQKMDDKQEKLEDKNDEIEKILSELDADNPIAIALRKAHRTNADTASQLAALKNKLDAMEKTQTEKATKATQEAEAKEVSQIRETFRATLDKLTTPDDPQAYKFLNDKIKDRWRRTVAEEMMKRTQEGEIKDFEVMLKEVAKGVFEAIDAERQEFIADYLKTKKPLKKEEPKPKEGEENAGLQDELETELNAILEKKK